MRILMAITLMTILSACVDNTQSSWDRHAWVDPMMKPNYSGMKALQQPGIY